jgi:hypothetical protein
MVATRFARAWRRDGVPTDGLFAVMFADWLQGRRRNCWSPPDGQTFSTIAYRPSNRDSRQRVPAHVGLDDEWCDGGWIVHECDPQDGGGSVWLDGGPTRIIRRSTDRPSHGSRTVRWGRWQRRCPESSTTMIRRLVAAARIAFPNGSRNDLRIGRNKRSAMGFPPLPKGAPHSERAFFWPPNVQSALGRLARRCSGTWFAMGQAPGRPRTGLNHGA